MKSESGSPSCHFIIKYPSLLCLIFGRWLCRIFVRPSSPFMLMVNKRHASPLWLFNLNRKPNLILDCYPDCENRVYSNGMV